MNGFVSETLGALTSDPAEQMPQDQPAIREKTRLELFSSDDFQLLVPSGCSRKIHSADGGLGEYGEFLFTVTPGSTQPETAVFYYWTQKRPANFDLKGIRNLCRSVAKTHLFEKGVSLRSAASITGSVVRFSSAVLKYRYALKELEAEGPIHFFVVDSEKRQKFFMLGILTEQGGDLSRECEVLKSLEDIVIRSFRFH